jgi:hypothetical protein
MFYQGEMEIQPYVSIDFYLQAIIGGYLLLGGREFRKELVDMT